jgi:hypothetical protein
MQTTSVTLFSNKVSCPPGYLQYRCNDPTTPASAVKAKADVSILQTQLVRWKQKQPDGGLDESPDYVCQDKSQE